MARKKTKDEARIRKEVRGRRDLARESRLDPSGDLKARREADLSRGAAPAEELKDDALKDVTLPFIRMELPSTSDPDCCDFPEDELDDIVKPIPHPFGRVYTLFAMKEARRAGKKFIPSEEDFKILFLGDGNVLNVEINTSSDFEDVLFAFRRLWKNLGCYKPSGTNLNKAPEIMDAYRKARIQGKGKQAKSSTELKRIKRAKELICGDFLAKGDRIARRVEKADLPVKSCDECPKKAQCVKLCAEMKPYVDQDYKAFKERHHPKDREGG